MSVLVWLMAMAGVALVSGVALLQVLLRYLPL
jgi:hypothetical protein